MVLDDVIATNIVTLSWNPKAYFRYFMQLTVAEGLLRGHGGCYIFVTVFSFYAIESVETYKFILI